VRYEDILAEPKTEIRRILNFCELPSPSENDKIFQGKIARIGVVHHKNTYGSFDIVETICRKNMQRFGYL
jgi:hypothetical protein